MAFKTLKELLEHNEVVRKARQAQSEKLIQEKVQFVEVANESDILENTVEATVETEPVEKKETTPKSKKGRKPKNRAYLVAEDLPFEEDDEVAKVVEDGNIVLGDEDSKLEKEVC